MWSTNGNELHWRTVMVCADICDVSDRAMHACKFYPHGIGYIWPVGHRSWPINLKIVQLQSPANRLVHLQYGSSHLTLLMTANKFVSYNVKLFSLTFFFTIILIVHLTVSIITTLIRHPNLFFVDFGSSDSWLCCTSVKDIVTFDWLILLHLNMTTSTSDHFYKH